ncbi:MAG: hypothetical protein ABJN40_13950 [Sneathiella sp.]
MGKFTLAFFGFIVSFAIATNVWSADFGAVYQDAKIENAVISHMKDETGSKAVLRFTLTNTAFDKLTITGVSSDRHGISHIMAEISPNKFVELDSLSILSEEHLNMADAKIYIELENLDLPGGTDRSIRLNLVLLNGEMPFRARLIDPTH